MKDLEQGISRRQAISRMTGAMLGAALAPQAIKAQAAAPRSEPKGKARARKQSRPNILWITTEGVPTHALSCYGSKLIDTPNIDRIAREGLRFSNAFVTNALCAPSRGVLLTGKYNHLNGMIGNPKGAGAYGDLPTFDAKQETVAKMLKRNGYQTGMVGKWHLPVNPGDVGFDYYVYKDGAGGPYYDPNGYLRNETFGSNDTVKKSYEGYITDNEIKFIKEGIEKFDRPFCLMYQPFSDHRPFQPPHKYEHIYDDVRIPEPGTFYDDYSSRGLAAREAHMRIADMRDFNPPADLTERQRKQWNYQQFMRHFLGTLKAQDDAIGDLLHYLDETGLSENTIVVYTGDHGFFLGDHGWFDKRFMYEQAIRVPFMVRAPSLTKAGSVTNDWTVNIDNAPTILELAGIPIPEDMQGKSVVPICHGQRPADWRKSFYYHYYEFEAPHSVLPFYGVRTERYKLIRYYTVDQWELFDLEKDPDEMESLFDETGIRVHPAYADVVPGLIDELKRLREQYKDTVGRPLKAATPNSYN